MVLRSQPALVIAPDQRRLVEEKRPLSLGQGTLSVLRHPPAAKQQGRYRPAQPQNPPRRKGREHHHPKARPKGEPEPPDVPGKPLSPLTALSAGHPVQQVSVSHRHPPQRQHGGVKRRPRLHREKQQLCAGTKGAAGQAGIDSGVVSAKAALSPAPCQLHRRRDDL